MDKIPVEYRNTVIFKLKDLVMQGVEGLNLDPARIPPQLFLTEMRDGEFDLHEDSLLFDDVPELEWKRSAEEIRIQLGAVGYALLCVVGDEDEDAEDYFCLVLNLGSLTEFTMMDLKMEREEKIQNPEFLPAYGESDGH